MGRATYTKRMKRRLSDATTDAARTVKKAGEGIECATLLLWEDIPAWQQDGNQFIETGYRYAPLNHHTPPIGPLTK